MRRLFACLALASTPALGVPPNACEVLSLEDVSSIAERPVVKVRPHKSGNPSECGFVDSRNAVVLVLALKEVQYAAKDEFDVERSNLEKVYKVRAKHNETFADGAFWMPGNKSMWFRKGKTIGRVKFETAKNQNEIDNAQIARLVESKLK